MADYRTAVTNRTRKAIQEVSGGAQMANKVSSDADGTVFIPDVLGKRKAWGPFGFSHLGAAGGGASQTVIVGDTDGEIATALSLTATAFATPSGCGTNAALNKQLDNEPVAIGSIALEYSDITQKGMSIQHAVLNPNGKVEVTDLTPLIQAKLNSGKFQGLIDNAVFSVAPKLGPFEALIYTVGDTKTLKVVHEPIVSKR